MPMMYKELLKKHVGRKCDISQGHNYAGCEIVINDAGVHTILTVSDEYVVFSDIPCGEKPNSILRYCIYLIENTSLVTDIKP